jgi:hypothetical protein
MDKKGFRPHDMKLAQTEHHAWRKEALKKGSRDSDEFYAEFNLLQLESVRTQGLMDCYRDFKEFLIDFAMDFPWTRSSKNVRKIMMDDPRFEIINDHINSTYGYDLKTDFMEAPDYY